MNLNGKQVMLIIAAVMSALVAASAQLTDIFGPATAKSIISVVSLANTILTAITASMSGQAGILRDVQAMPGVEKIVTNSQANSTLNQLAADPANPKIQKGA